MPEKITRRSFVRKVVGSAIAGIAIGDGLMDSCAGDSVSGYQLVWHDEFNSQGPPDPNNWIFEQGLVRNHELQWYQPQNAHCADGRLIITARREKVANPNYQPDGRLWSQRRRVSHYTSASLKTKGKHSWRYGIFTMRARINTNRGIWPAWWTIGDHKPWPACGEIDIMEYECGHVNANVGWQNRAGRTHWKSVFTPITSFHDPHWSDKFHIWAMRWEPDAIRLFLDGKLMNHVPLSKTIDPRYQNYNPFHHKAFMILNLAVGPYGGKGCGDPSQTKFPALFEVDYVRVYQRH